jgi:PAS domain S-box-containing protein
LKDSNPDSFHDKDLASLSKEELVESLRELQCRTPEASAAAIDHLQQTVQQLRVHRVELEMQNRALRETQQELEQSVRRYSDLFDHLPTGYLITSVQGQILCANPAAMELLDQPQGELVGKFVRRFLDSYDAGRFAVHVDACAASGRQSIIELPLRLGSGANIAVQLSSRLAPPLPGVEQHLHIAVADVSQLKRTQRMLEEVNREQEAFNYSISHDLRAPLVTISNYARIVLSDHHEALDEEGSGMLHRIENAAMRMEETLKHLLEYSMLAREEVVLQALELNEVLRDVMIEHRGLIQRTQAEVIVAPDLPAVRGSRVILVQVLANLLTNALKYTQPGVPPRVEIGAAASARGVVIYVRDHGIGIEEKYHARIFEIFERLHGYTKYPGSGVGLAIARRAVERMNGRIWLESQPGQGSTFYIELVQG